MAVTLRKSKPDDDDLLFRLFAEHKAEEFALLGMGEEQRRFMVTMQYRLRCAGYGADFPVAIQQIVEEDGDPIGHLLLDEGPHGLRIVDIAVAGAHRGRGVGTAVLRALCERAGSQGRSIRLRVIPHSAAARLYRRLGFVVVSGDEMGEEMIWRSSAIDQ
jgi:ribosomal protein S18 acetylase RimI-like enzyme